ncbi:MAG: NfeD family protein [Polyangiaceae bacterium]|nr:NfeD family protein [Polyangiaceae bacterium]
MTLLGTLYIAALIIGLGANLLQFVLAGLGGDVDADHGDVGADLDADADVSGEVHGDISGDAHSEVVSPAGQAGHDGIDGGFFPLVLSLRFWTFGLLAFGLVAVPLHFLALAPEMLVPVIAGAVGLPTGLAVSWMFRALGRATSQSGADVTDAVGQVGRVLVPVARGARGKIRIQLRGQTIDYLATTDEDELEAGAEVLVSEVRSDQVHVCRAPSEFRGPPSDGTR